MVVLGKFCLLSRSDKQKTYVVKAIKYAELT